ncbi:8-amino-7-oxononanoate synthase [Mesonia phycicola]|uniref:8-amino-7-oxononanoate synthase n=1 Tax=Mesonia phycicola TaxID=579105 RepID=A0A1M6CPP2_9FLAO|nr:8-amino-7-oxononanoate synthase [Mesonia phycicola]SHI62853.1 8-amino-7-oxononanoate synthase [Mesonia phycicola]
MNNNQIPNGILKKLERREKESSLRDLSLPKAGVDFFSNDYLGFAKNKKIYTEASAKLEQKDLPLNSSTGSRLLSGNSILHQEVEKQIAQFHQAESALLFNSGYDANLGFFSSVPQRGDVIFYDEHIHASIRDGLNLSLATSYKYQHNNLSDLKQKVARQNITGNIFVVTESVFSMDGDTPDLEELVQFCEDNGVFLVVDEAHAIGVFGEKGEGLLQDKNLHSQIFARIITFGKGLGAHGAVVLGSEVLKKYLINFARSLIYTTSISPHAVATISSAYHELLNTSAIEMLKQNICYFKNQLDVLELASYFNKSDSAIQSCIISGNHRVKLVAERLQQQNFLVKAILSPTVPKGKERLRFCLHSYNTEEEIFSVLQLLSEAIK